MTRRKTDFGRMEKEIIERLDLAAEFEAMGVQIAGRTPGPDGWISCHAVGREDRSPSAGINIQTGQYKDHGGDGECMSFWEFAARHGGHGDWRAARKHFADKAGVEMPTATKAGPSEQLTIKPWNAAVVSLWCPHKPPITPEAVRACHGELADYGRFVVVAMPIFGADGETVGWGCWNTTGDNLPVKSGSVKMKTMPGSRNGLYGPVEMIADAEVVWKTEGPGDMIAMTVKLIEAGLFGRHVAVSNSSGTNEHLRPETLKRFAGKRVIVIHDADADGQKGAKKQAAAIARHAEKVWRIDLPYEIAKKHGKDLRDFFTEGHGLADLRKLVDAAEPVESSDEIDDLEDDDPYRLAKLYLDRYEPADDGKHRLVYYRDSWQRWNGVCYRTIEQTDVKCELQRALQQEFLSRSAESGDKARKTTTQLVSNVFASLKSITHVPARHVQPCWLGGNDPHDPCEIFATPNGLIHLPSFVDGDDYFIEPSSDFFTANGVDYVFDVDAPPPESWLRFLDDLWAGDHESIEMMQEWFGYCLLPDTSLQKMLMIVGPKRSGKGTIGRVLTKLLGETNVVGPKLSSIGTQFGLAPFIGKTLAIVADARLSHRADAHAIVENLLSISGEDTQTIDRKHREMWTGRLSTRFMIMSNELPSFSDAAGAIASRIILLQTNNSFYGREDTSLGERILRELPGILLWAIEGYRRLRERGYFLEPESSRELSEELQRVASPVIEFIESRCVIDPMELIPVDDLYDEWRDWCKSEGIDHPGTKIGFGKKLRAACPVKRGRMIVGGERPWCYLGINLNSTARKRVKNTSDRGYYKDDF